MISDRATTRYRLVILDFDGTLADSGPWFARVLNEVARRYRFREIDREELETLRGESPADMLRRLRVARWKLPFISRHMRARMTRDLAEVTLFLGIDDLIARLHAADVALAVVTSNAERNVRGVLGSDLSARVQHFACGSSLLGKAPKIRKLVARFGLPAAAVLSVGDEIRDIDAAEAAGIASGAVTWGYASPAALRARHPTFVFETVDEIVAAVLSPEMHVAVHDVIG